MDANLILGAIAGLGGAAVVGGIILAVVAHFNTKSK